MSSGIVEVDITEAGRHHHHQHDASSGVGGGSTSSGWSFLYVAGIIFLCLLVVALLIGVMRFCRRRNAACDDTTWVPLANREFGF